MKCFLWLTLLFSLAAAAHAQAGSAFGGNVPYLMNSAQRRMIPKQQPGSGTSVQLTGVRSSYSRRTEKDLMRAPQQEGRSLSDWELVQQWMQGDAPSPTHWTAHRGTPEESVARVVVFGEGGAQTSYSALVVRCDGFLMAPQAVWDAMKERRPVAVYVTKAEAEDEVGPFPVLFRSPHKSRRPEVHFLKLNNHHLRCLPVLASWNLSKGTALRVVWAVPSVDGKHIEAKSALAVCTSVPTEPRGTLSTLSFEGGAAPAGLPSGAVVLDRETGGALGMIHDARQPTQFANTRLFNDICADVALAPDRDAVLGKTPPPEASMVKVPGGPVVFDNKDFVRAYQTAIACTPDFYCDKYLVTVGDWQGYIDTRRDRPLPDGWDARNRRFPPTLFPKLPVTGPMAGDMKDYATLRNKRLLTAVEWLRAAQTGDLAWLARLEIEMDEVSAAITQAKNLLDRAVNLRLENLRANLSQSSQASGIVRNALQNGAKVQGSIEDLTISYVQNLEQIRRKYAKFIGKLPGQPRDVGTFGDDKSDAGVYDVTLNVPEACLGLGLNYGYTPKLMPAGQDPFVSQLFYAGMISSSSVEKSGSGGIWGTLAGAGIDDPIVWAGMWSTQFGGDYRDLPFQQGPLKSVGARAPGDLNPESMVGSYVLDIKSRSNLGFRCAR